MLQVLVLSPYGEISLQTRNMHTFSWQEVLSQKSDVMTECRHCMIDEAEIVMITKPDEEMCLCKVIGVGAVMDRFC